MTDHEEYFEYLTTRSRAALWYRRFLLYPLLDRFLVGRTLDVGCGLGDMLAFRRDTVGVDVNPLTVAFCQERGLDARLVESDGRLPFGDSTFDSVVLDNVLEHIAVPAPLLNEIRRVLRTNGVFVVGVPGARGYASDPDHKVYYDEPRLVSSLASMGFTCARVLHLPWRAEALSRRLRQYCLYGVFVRS